MLSWQVGAVKITRVVEMQMPIPYSPDTVFLKEATPAELRKLPWLYPHFVGENDELLLSIHALLVEAPGLRLVVDTCVGNDKPRAGMTGPGGLQTRFLASLAEAGWDRDGVDAVVCTHMHVDHVGWNTMLVDGAWVPTFPNARYLLGRAEFDHWMGEGDDAQKQILADSVQPVLDAGLVDWVPLDHAISQEIRLTPTIGHTPGHVSVVIESQGEKAVITGDMSHHPCQLAHPHWSPSFDSDPKAAAATRARMFAEWADEPTLVIGTHYAGPTAGRVRRDGAAFRFEV
ncbi:MAG: MBL fold metallo-hydrolase [Phenylobacterium sp.]|uniref:MBL fold metallo-hydrolase n=1 Tax=Phenylobacterium sp. TaxID=1871053 RepID=UPI001A5F2B6A|nr:MBL fold metallo-hydrolase [Phenylobacterium sp.]MBL8556170.1 MBL fold metallo-hydrolase [Phenylobacterium sp.]